MEDGSQQLAGHDDDGDGGRRPPPPAPRPSTDACVKPDQVAIAGQTDTPLKLTTAEWDINSISAVAAMSMLQEALDRLADATGDVPPTPPLSRPASPSRQKPSPKQAESAIPDVEIGSPVAHPHEAIHITDLDNDNQLVQHAAIARRFFSKVAPSFTLKEYLNRCHHWCPHSPGVYLAAAAYCYRLCVTDSMVPATKRTIHRLALASIRVSAKALEDNKWTQERVAKVGGVGLTQLLNLEVSLCFLLDFDLWMNETMMAKNMFLLQQAGKEGLDHRGRLGEFKLKLPVRKRQVLAQMKV